MKALLFVAAIATFTAVAVQTSEAEPLNCTYEYEYAPGPVDLDPDGDGKWFEDDSGIEQRGPVIAVTRVCSGEESTEVDP